MLRARLGKRLVTHGGRASYDVSLITSCLLLEKDGALESWIEPCSWGKVCVCRQAAGAGNLQALQAWFAECHCCCGDCCCKVTFPGQIHPHMGPRFCTAAAYNGQLAMLQWLRQLGCPWNSATCSAAACSNHLQVSSSSAILFSVTRCIWI